MKKEELIKKLKRYKTEIKDMTKIKVYKSGDVELKYFSKFDIFNHVTLAKYNDINLKDSDLQELKKELEIIREK